MFFTKYKKNVLLHKNIYIYKLEYFTIERIKPAQMCRLRSSNI